MCKYNKPREDICKTSAYPICQKISGVLTDDNKLSSTCWCNSEICNAGDHCSINGCIVADCDYTDGTIKNTEKCQCGLTKCDVNDYCSSDFNVCSKIAACEAIDGLGQVANRCQCGANICQADSYCNQEKFSLFFANYRSKSNMRGR